MFDSVVVYNGGKLRHHEVAEADRGECDDAVVDGVHVGPEM